MRTNNTIRAIRLALNDYDLIRLWELSALIELLELWHHNATKKYET